MSEITLNHHNQHNAVNLCLIRSYSGTGFPSCSVVECVYVGNGQMTDEQRNGRHAGKRLYHYAPLQFVYFTHNYRNKSLCGIQFVFFVTIPFFVLSIITVGLVQALLASATSDTGHF